MPGIGVLPVAPSLVEIGFILREHLSHSDDLHHDWGLNQRLAPVIEPSVEQVRVSPLGSNTAMCPEVKNSPVELHAGLPAGMPAHLRDALTLSLSDCHLSVRAFGVTPTEK